MSIIKGWLGEKITSLGIWAFLDKKVYSRFHDIIVPSKNGTTQTDHILVSKFGIFVIETKNMKGWIFGSEKQPKWTQSIYRKKSSFQNPLRQNYRHIKCLSEHLNLDLSYFHSVVFFIGDCTFKTQMPENVICSGLSSYIKSHRKILLSPKEVYRISDQLKLLKENPALNRKEHLKSLSERHSSTSHCPKCGSALVERIVKKGSNAGSTFLGCSKFPKCRFTQKDS